MAGRAETWAALGLGQCRAAGSSHKKGQKPHFHTGQRDLRQPCRGEPRPVPWAGLEDAAPVGRRCWPQVGVQPRAGMGTGGN